MSWEISFGTCYTSMTCFIGKPWLDPIFLFFCLGQYVSQHWSLNHSTDKEFLQSNAFQDVGFDSHRKTFHASRPPNVNMAHNLLRNLENLPQLARISTALGAMYSTTAIIDAFGVFCASMVRHPKKKKNHSQVLTLQQQRQTLIRVYAHLAFISAMLVTVAGFVAGVSYYVLSVCCFFLNFYH